MLYAIFASGAYVFRSSTKTTYRSPAEIHTQASRGSPVWCIVQIHARHNSRQRLVPSCAFCIIMRPAEDVQNGERKDRGMFCSCVPEGTTLGNAGGSGSAVTAADLLARLLQTKLHPISLAAKFDFSATSERPIQKSDVNRLTHVRSQRLDKTTPFLIENFLPATRTTVSCLEGHRRAIS